MRRIGLGLALAAVVATAALAHAGTAQPPPVQWPPRATTFLSLWPACACGRHTVLDAFSLRTGRRVATLATIPTSVGESVSGPTAVPSQAPLITFSSGPGCAGPPFSHGMCQPLPDSCQSRVASVARSGHLRDVLSFPTSVSVLDATPSPRGHLIELLEGGCATSYFDLHLVVRNLATGREWSIGADAPRCHGIGAGAWNVSATELVFPYAPSILRYGTPRKAVEFCSAPRFGRLVVVSALHGSSSRAWHLITAERHCSFVAAAFDRTGIAAVEECQLGHHGVFSNPLNLGPVFLVQLDHHDRRTFVLPLRDGWEDGLLSTDFRNGSVLISEDQPANAGYPERDWVWSFDGHRLRLIAHYRANDAAQVIAATW